jgi:hypothetical protein
LKLIQLGGIEHSGQKAIDMGAVALKAGILHIDTAQVSLGLSVTRCADKLDLWNGEGGWTSHHRRGYGQERCLGDYEV